MDSRRARSTPSSTSPIVTARQPSTPNDDARIAVGNRGTSPVSAKSTITGMPRTALTTKHSAANTP